MPRPEPLVSRLWYASRAIHWLNCTATCSVPMPVLQKELVVFVAVDETIVNVVNDPKRRGSPPRLEAKVFNNERFGRGLKLRRQRKTEPRQIASKRRRDTSRSGFYCRTGCSNTVRTCQTCGV